MASKSNGSDSATWFDAMGKVATDSLDGLADAMKAYDEVETHVTDLMKETLAYQVSLARQMRTLTIEAARTSIAWLG